MKMYTKKQYKKDFARFKELAAGIKAGPYKSFGKKSGSKITPSQAKKELAALETKFMNEGVMEFGKKPKKPDEVELPEEKKEEDYFTEIGKRIKEEEENKPVKDKIMKEYNKLLENYKYNELLKKDTKDLTNKEKSELANIEEKEIKKIEKLEKAIEDQTQIIEQEIKITTNDKGEKEVEIKKKTRKAEDSEDDELPPLKYGKDKDRHKKLYEPDDERQEISSEYKTKLKNAIMIGKAGGARKIIECPHCEGRMLAAGVRAVASKREQTAGQKAWQDYIKMVASKPENKGMKRSEIVKLAGKTWKDEKTNPASLETYLTKEVYEEHPSKSRAK